MDQQKQKNPKQLTKNKLYHHNFGQSHFTKYIIRSKENEATFQVNVMIKYSKGKYKRNRIKHFTYAVYNMNTPIKNTFKEYKKNVLEQNPATGHCQKVIS